MISTEPNRKSVAKTLPSRQLGRAFTIVFVILSCIPVLKGDHPNFWMAATAILFFLLSTFFAGVLDPLTRIWLKIGDILHAITTPIIMGVVYFGTVVPTGLIQKLVGRDVLRLTRHEAAETYWIDRRPPGPSRQSMKQQF